MKNGGLFLALFNAVVATTAVVTAFIQHDTSLALTASVCAFAVGFAVAVHLDRDA